MYDVPLSDNLLMMKRIFAITLTFVAIACQQSINPDNLPVVCFEISNTPATPGDLLHFSNCTNNADNYYWNFGDGTISREKHAQHVYYSEGEYRVVLYASNDQGRDSLIKFIMISNNCEEFFNDFDLSYGIDYSSPNKYLIAGDQSNLDEKHVSWVKGFVGEPDQTITYIKYVCDFINQQFAIENAGGAMIGLVTANDLFTDRKVYGCHSQALAISSVLRKLGFPCVLVEGASVKWAREYLQHTNQGLSGHVMTEVYINQHWILLDNNGQYVDNYDPLNPYIYWKGADSEGLLVIAKGVDTWEYYERLNAETDQLMFKYAFKLPCFEEYFNTTNYSWQN